MGSEGPCGIFSSVSGKLVAISLTLLAFLAYTVSFTCRRGRTDFRSWQVFWLDLAKMGIGQAAAYAINIANTSRNASHDYDDLSWYFPTFLNDELIAVPLGVLIWHITLAGARRLSRRYPNVVWLQALQASGRYYSADASHLSAPLNDGSHDPSPHGAPATCQAVETVRSHPAAPHRPTTPAPASKAACGCAGAAARVACGWCCHPCATADDRTAPVRYDWWLVQLLFWVTAVLASRELGGAGIPIVSRAMGSSSPYHRLAEAIDNLQWSCATKRWTFAGVFRILVDLAQLFFVDSLNKFRRGRPKASSHRAAV